MNVALELQPCCGKRSGIGAYAYELARRMTDGDGLAFCGNLFNFRGRNDNAAALAGISIPVRENRLMPYGVYRRIWNALPVAYDSLFPKADLSVFFNYIVPPRIHGRVMTTVYDLTYLRYPETMQKVNLTRLREGMDRSVGRSDRIVTISEFSKREITQLLHIAPEKIDVVPCAPAGLAPGADFAATAEKYGLRQPYFLYVGTIEPRKNLARLIRAFGALKKWGGLSHQLVLAGGGGWNTEEIHRTAAASPDAKDIVFTGFVSAGEKTALYENAEVFVFPSLYEGFGIPPLEAMSQRCPVVCADAASLPEVVEDAALLVNPLDETALAEAMLSAATDEAVRRALREKGLRRVAAFTWESSAERLRAACKEVFKNS